jgi:hypothetical protein
MTKFKKTDSLSTVIACLGNSIVTGDGRMFSYVPVWFEHEDDDYVIVHDFEKLPTDLLQSIIDRRNGNQKKAG